MALSVLNLFDDIRKLTMEQIKRYPLYKMIMGSLPEIFISIYSISVIASLISDPEKGGIKGLVHFLDWVHLEIARNPIQGFVNWVNENQSAGLDFLFIGIFIFLFISSYNFYVRDSLDRILSRSKKNISRVPMSGYIFTFSMFVFIDYVINFRKFDKWLIIVPLGLAVVISIFYALFYRKELREAGLKWDSMKDLWHNGVGFHVFASMTFVVPVLLSIFVPVFILAFIAIGYIDSPSGGSALFSGTKDLQEERRKKIEEWIEEVKRKAYMEYLPGSQNESKMRGAILSARGNSKIFPVFPDERVYDVIRRISSDSNNSCQGPVIIVTEFDGELYTYTIK